MTHVRRYQRGRGLLTYGRPLKDTYGGRLEVSDSSSAQGPHVWLRVITPNTTPTNVAQASSHLNLEQANGLVARLQTWIDLTEGR